MIIDCKEHGRVKALPDSNHVVRCPDCVHEAVQELLHGVPSVPSPPFDESLDVSCSCVACGMAVVDGHRHTARECLVHRVMSS